MTATETHILKRLDAHLRRSKHINAHPELYSTRQIAESLREGIRIQRIYGWDYLVKLRVKEKYAFN